MLPPVPLCDQLALWLLIALFTFAPLAFGAVNAWSEFVVLATCLGLLVCLAIRGMRRKSTGGLRWTPAYYPMALFILFAFLQVVPVPFGLLDWLSPSAAELYADPRSEGFGASYLSLYPRGTWHDLCLVIFAATVFLTVVNVVRRSSQVKTLLLATAIIGAGLAILALIQGLFSNGHIYWIGPGIVQENSGTFACHNHFSQHMNLSVMAMLAYAMVRLRETLGRGWLERSSISEWFTAAELRFTRWLVVFAICGLIAVAVSVSRMGIIAAVVALMALSLFIAIRNGRQRAVVPIMVGLVAVSAVILVGFEMVFERMATLKSFDSYAGRWQIVSDLVPAFGDFLTTGSGLGTFSAVYPMYDMGTTTQFASHAENEYAQLLLEMGLPGLILVLWFVVIIARCAYRTSIRSDHPVMLAAPALAAGLLAVAIHSWTDFGQHLPAIAILSATFCGLLVAMDLRPRASRSTHAEKAIDAVAAEGDLASPAPAAPVGTGRPWLQTTAPAAVLVVLFMILGFNAPASLMRVFAEACDVAGRRLADELEASRWRGTDAQYDQLLSLAERAVIFDPGNAVHRYRLAVYRWHAVARGRTGEELGKTPSQELVLTAEKIVDEMIDAACRSPSMGALYCWRGQMEAWVLGQGIGREHIRKGIQTAKADPIAWQAAARLSAVDGDAEQAFEQLRRCVELRRGMLRTAGRILLKDLNRPDLLLALAGDDPERLSEVSWILRDNGFTEQSKEARMRSLEAFRGLSDSPNTPTWALVMLAEDAASANRHNESAELYRRALSREYTRLPWRLACVRQLIAAGRHDEAVLELQICERLNAQKRQADIERQINALRRAASATTQPAAEPPEQQEPPTPQQPAPVPGNSPAAPPASFV